MTKAQLIKALEPYPDDMNVFLDERMSEFQYGLLNGVTSQEITFDDGEEARAEEEVIILSEE